MRNRASIAVAAVVLLGLGVGLAALTASTRPAGKDADGVPLHAVSCAWIRAQPVTRLSYPGATVLKTSCRASTGASGDYAAEVTYFTSTATGAHIYQWYDQQLTALGWSYVNDGGCYDYQVSCPGYEPIGWTRTKPKREVAGVAIEYPRALPIGAGIDPPHTCTVYESDLLVFPTNHGIAVPDPKWARFSGGHACWWTPTGWLRRPPP